MTAIFPELVRNTKLDALGRVNRIYKQDEVCAVDEGARSITK